MTDNELASDQRPAWMGSPGAPDRMTVDGVAYSADTCGNMAWATYRNTPMETESIMPEPLCDRCPLAGPECENTFEEGCPQAERTVLGVNDFVRRQVPGSRFSHHESLSFEDIAKMAVAQWDEKVQGYREGVYLVPVPIEGFVSGIVPLETATEIYARCEARRDGEAPVLVVTAVGPRLEVTSVDIVVYSKEALGDDVSHWDSEFEIVSINAGCGAPQDPISMARNSLEQEGGTKTDYPPEAWAASVDFWSKHALAAEG